MSALDGTAAHLDTGRCDTCGGGVFGLKGTTIWRCGRCAVTRQASAAAERSRIVDIIKALQHCCSVGFVDAEGNEEKQDELISRTLLLEAIERSEVTP